MIKFPTPVMDDLIERPNMELDNYCFNEAQELQAKANAIAAYYHGIAELHPELESNPRFVRSRAANIHLAKSMCREAGVLTGHFDSYILF